MKSYAHILRALYDEPWAILPAKLEMIVQVLDRVLAVEPAPEGWEAAARAGQSISGQVAVIPVMGILAQHGGMIASTSTALASADMIGQMISKAAADPNIGALVLNIDSPGGSVYGIAELGSLIAQAGQSKPIIAQANSLAASAAYWIASQCAEIVVTPGGEVGSIGVLAAHTDTSQADAAQGYKTTLIHAGQYKVEGNPYEPLSDEARTYTQSRVDDYYAMFVTAVASGRKVPADAVRNGMGQGRVVGAKAAVKLGMADKVATLDQTIARFQSGRARVGAKAEAFVNRQLVETVNRSRARYQLAPLSDEEIMAANPYEPEPYQPDPDETVQCPQCGAMNDADARYCDQCGYELAGSEDVEDQGAAAAADLDFRRRRLRLAGAR